MIGGENKPPRGLPRSEHRHHRPLASRCRNCGALAPSWGPLARPHKTREGWTGKPGPFDTTPPQTLSRPDCRSSPLGSQAARAQPPNRRRPPSRHSLTPQPPPEAKSGTGCRTRGGGSAAANPAAARSAHEEPRSPTRSPTRFAPARRRRGLQQLRETQRPDPRGTQPRLPGSSLPFYPPAVPGLAVSAAHGAGSGGGNVNKSGFYSYLTLECRVHLLSARYQTPAAPNRVFTKAGCAKCVAEARASDTTLR